MALLLGFLPFAVFAAAGRFLSTLAALSLAALAALVLTGRDLAAKKSLKWLDLGACAVFGGLAIYTLATGTNWSVLGVRLCADAGLFLIVAASLAARAPFTLQYAKEKVPESRWSSPVFLAVNDRLTAAWAAAFAGMVLADFAMLRGLPVAAGVALSLAALGGAFLYTRSVAR